MLEVCIKYALHMLQSMLQLSMNWASSPASSYLPVDFQLASRKLQAGLAMTAAQETHSAHGIFKRHSRRLVKDGRSWERFGDLMMLE